MPKPRCVMCGTKRMAGVMDYPRLTHDGKTEERLIERCDTCGRYKTDAEAAIHYATRFRGRLRYDKRVVIWTPEQEAGAAEQGEAAGLVVDEAGSTKKLFDRVILISGHDSHEEEVA